MKVSVVIPVFNQSHLTQRCLDSLIQNSSILQDVIIIDNASSDDTETLLNQFREQFSQTAIHFSVIKNDKNLGFGRACNQGIREYLKSDAPYLFILNNDTWLMPGWDRALIEAMNHHSVDCIGPYFYEKPFHDHMTKTAKNFVSRNRHGFRNHFVPILMCFNRSAVEKLSADCPGSNGGMFDERYFVTYEDTDLLNRMKSIGLKYGQTGSCFIWHRSQGTRSSSALPSGYEQEGLKLFMEKWGYDPRPLEYTFRSRMKKRYWRFLEWLGKF